MQYITKNPVQAFVFGDTMPEWFMDRVADQTVILHRIPFDTSRPLKYGQLWCEIIQNGEKTTAVETRDVILLLENGELFSMPQNVFTMLFEGVTDVPSMYKLPDRVKSLIHISSDVDLYMKVPGDEELSQVVNSILEEVPE